MSGRGAIALVAGRELNQRLRTKSFVAATAAIVVMILAIGIAARLSGGTEDLDVAVSGPVPEGFEQALVSVGAALDRGLVPIAAPDADAARKLLTDGDVGLAVLGADRTVLFGGEIDPQLLALVQQAWSVVETRESLVDAGLTEAQIAEAFSAAPPRGESLDPDDEETPGLAVLTGTLGAILLFISLQTFGGYVLMGVVEEKSSAVIELLLARVQPSRLLVGKVLGIGIAALVQFAASIVASVGSLLISGVEIPGAIWSAVPMLLVWFLLGYTLYSMLFAVAGSLVSRQEDAQAAAAPILTAMIGGYVLVNVFGYVPESTASRIMSVLPPITPFLMPMRMAAGAASVFEIALAVVLMVAAIAATSLVAGRIYEAVLLHRGSRIGWKEAFRLGRAHG